MAKTRKMTFNPIAFWPREQWTHLIFAAAFIGCGICLGSYFPLAADQLARDGFQPGRAGSKLETADHLGASVGGLLTSLALVPVLGSQTTLVIFVLLISLNLPPAILRIYKPEKICSLHTTTFRLRKLGYVLFGVAVSVILCSNLFARSAARLRPALPESAAQALAADLQIVPASAAVSASEKTINYFKVYKNKDELAGYIFSSRQLAPEVRGFGGAINLAVYLDTNGTLINFHIIRSNETPAYLDLLSRWRATLIGRRLFHDNPFAGVDAVTGATISSDAVLSALQKSARKFAQTVLGQTFHPTAQKRQYFSYQEHLPVIYFISAFLLSLIVIYRGGVWSRLAVLAYNLVAGGIIFNLQYSSEQIAGLLSLHIPQFQISATFLLLVAVPLLVLIFGNIYCGYLCPFGAAQELLACLVRQNFRQQLTPEKMKKARFVKYVVLFLLVLLFFISRDHTTLAADALIKVFTVKSHFYTGGTIAIIAVALIGSLFYSRFWCRYLCPTGAFLSLLNNISVLKRYLPKKRFARCEFGLSYKDQTDCIYCDRCRYQYKTILKQQPWPTPSGSARILSRYFVPAVILIAVLVSAVSVKRFFEISPATFEQPAPFVSSGGQPRDVDLRQIRTMIQQNKLSDKKADYYKEVQ